MDEEPADEAWATPELKDWSSDAKRNGKVYNIPEEKKAAMAILDDELAKSKKGSAENAEADNRLDSTLCWLRKRQTDTIALENRQMCRIYDLDLMADEMETLGKNSLGRDKTSAKLKRDTQSE